MVRLAQASQAFTTPHPCQTLAIRLGGPTTRQALLRWLDVSCLSISSPRPSATSFSLNADLEISSKLCKSTKCWLLTFWRCSSLFRVDACHAVGVNVMVDILFNHMAGIDSGSGVAGSSFSHYNYPGIYDSSNFHYCGTTNNAISECSSSCYPALCSPSGLDDYGNRQYLYTLGSSDILAHRNRRVAGGELPTSQSCRVRHLATYSTCLLK